MYDMQGVIGGPIPQQGEMMPGMAPSAGSPTGAPAQADPLKYGIDVIVMGLEQLSAQARRVGDEALSTEVGTMALKLRRRQQKRQATADAAIQQGQAQVIMGQM